MHLVSLSLSLSLLSLSLPLSLSLSLSLGGNSEGNFEMNRTGVLTVKKDLDREEIPVYTIIVKASSNPSWTPVRAQRASWTRALDPGRDPTLQEVNIYLEDINDQSPRFLKKEYTAGKG